MYKSFEILRAYTNLAFDESEINEENQNVEYEGFSVPRLNFRSRLAKKTPKKSGFFVTHYVKENEGNRPYTEHESLETLIICIPNEGVFLFPKHILIQKQIVTSTKMGKMGFRVYLPQEINLNASARSTQAWQSQYYIGAPQ